MSSGCHSIPRNRSAIDKVAVRGAKAESASDVEDKVATMASPKFLGLFRGVVYDYELFSRATLQRDLARIERYYRARGYYDAHAIAGLVLETKDNHVRVEIEVEEGPPVVNAPSKIEGITGLPKEIVDAINQAAQEKLTPGDPFDEDKFEEAQNAVRKALTDRGYAYAKVDRDALVDLVKHVALPVFTVTPDQPAKFGKVVIEGRASNSATIDIEIPEAVMRRAIDIEEGEPYSTKAIEDATHALLDLEVFSAVEVEPELPDPPPASHVVPLRVRVEPNRLRHLRLGGGIEFDQLKTDVHGLIGWEDKNFLGGLRSFRVDFKPGVVLYPVQTTRFSRGAHELVLAARVQCLSSPRSLHRRNGIGHRGVPRGEDVHLARSHLRQALHEPRLQYTDREPVHVPGSARRLSFDARHLVPRGGGAARFSR
jgi:outer membrane protein insertion porin family/translocation and assembly module TamA